MTNIGAPDERPLWLAPDAVETLPHWKPGSSSEWCGDGLGFAKQKDGSWYKMRQSGPPSGGATQRCVQCMCGPGYGRGDQGRPRTNQRPRPDRARFASRREDVVWTGGAGRLNAGRQQMHSGRTGRHQDISPLGRVPVITAKSGIPATFRRSRFILDTQPLTTASGSKP